MSEHDGQDSRPPPPSWLDKDFVQTALRAGDNDPSVTVLSCEFSLATAVGDGYLSNIYRVLAKLESNEERSLIVKCYPLGGKQEIFVKKLHVFDREIKMFSETLPAMQSLLNKIGTPNPLCARCLYYGEEPVQFLVLEDLCALGFKLENRSQGLGEAHCKLVLKALAQFHASSLVYLEDNPSAVEYYKQSLVTDDIRDDFIPFFVNCLKVMEGTVLKWPGYERFAKKIETARQDVFDRLLLVSKYQEGKFNTLIHADTWINNMMFKYSGNAVEEVRLVDFQGSYYTSPTLDLQDFLTTCPKEEVRDNLETLLKEYHSILINVLDKLHYSGKRITFEELQKDYEEHALQGFVLSCSKLPILMSERSKKLNIEDMLQENTTKECMNDIAEEGVYERIMKKLLLKYEELGVL